MISSVSSVSFKAATPQMDPISRPGKFTQMPKEGPAEAKKSHKALKVILGIVASAAVVSGLLIAGSRRNWFAKLVNSEKFSKIGEGLNKAGKWLDDTIWKPVAELPSKIIAKFKKPATTPVNP